MTDLRPISLVCERGDMTLTEFLEARITEQEIRCRTILDTEDVSPWVRRSLQVALADCRAKRRIIEVQTGLGDDDEPSWELMALAEVWADHPHYRQDWRP
ncbi:DUF6221 family protein [Pedococcus sp. 5OH_020]|uniref:DUF6221 family protein n=1 Tax=Pedococcus sp. 5OH_020 TaxID=2989814 RepID=UPI0022E9C4F0|nr:DUF6221 family protein [Pedococcus sp. 5OH_020]